MAEPTVAAAFQAIPVDQIMPSTHQARKVFNQDALKGLAESMKQEGLMQPITIRLVKLPSAILSSSDSPIRYELVAGERRLRAAKLLGWPTIDARVIQTVSEAEAAAKGLIENIQREDLNPIEEAEGFKDLCRLDPTYWTQDRIVQICGKSKTYVSQSLALLSLPEDVKNFVSTWKLTRSHAESLLSLSDPRQQSIFAADIARNDLSVRESEKRVKAYLNKPPRRRHGKQKGTYDPLLNLWPQLLSNRTIDAVGAWVVSFKDDHWNFSISSKAAPTKEDLAKWFKQMSETIDTTADLSSWPSKLS